jgi:hypothetical protein
MVAAEEDRRERQSSVGEDEAGDGDAADEEAWQQHLSILRTLAAAGPGNIRAAEAIAASAASPVIRAREICCSCTRPLSRKGARQQVGLV